MALKDWKKYKELEWRNNDGDSIRIEKHKRDFILWDVWLNNEELYSNGDKKESLKFAKKYMEKN